MQLIRFLIISILIFTASNGQSLLAMRYPTGVSIPISGYSARMGGSGIGATDNYTSMSLNPGNLGNIVQSVYTLKLQYDYLNLKSSSSSTVQSSFYPHYIGFAFPLKKFGTIGASFIKPSGNKYVYNSGDVVLTTNGNALPDEDVTELDGKLAYMRQTGLNGFEVGYGYDLFSFLKPGITYRRFNYSVEDARISIYNGIGGTVDSTRWYQEGNMLRFGISGGLLKGKLNYGITGAYAFKGDLRYNRNLLKIDSSEHTGKYITNNLHDSTNFVGIYQLQLPPEGGAGISIIPSEKVHINLDYSMVLWKNMWTDAPEIIDLSKLINSYKIASGVEYTPSSNLLKPRYWEKIMYSAGFRYEALPKDGDWEMSATIGTGLPLGKLGLFEFAAEGGMRRSKEYSDYKENFVRLTFSTSGGRLWKTGKKTVY